MNATAIEISYPNARAALDEASRLEKERPVGVLKMRVGIDTETNSSVLHLFLDAGIAMNLEVGGSMFSLTGAKPTPSEV